MSLIDRISMTEADWSSLAGGTGEASWLARRTTKLALGRTMANELTILAAALRERDATYRCSADVLDALPKAGYWYACLAGLASKTLGNIRRGPEAFQLNRAVKGMVEDFWEGRNFPRNELVAFSNWINDELDRLYPEDSRDAERALVTVALIAGGRVLGQSQNVGGDEAVTICKTELVGACNDMNYPVQVLDADGRIWVNYSPDFALAEQLYIRVPGRAVLQFVPGGNRPDMVIYPDTQPANGNFQMLPLPPRAETGIIAVAEVKGRLDLANAWESWMPQVVTHMRQWSQAYPGAARLFLGTLLTNAMVGLGHGDDRETLRSIYAERINGRSCLTAAYNLTKVGERDEASRNHFNNLVRAICAP